MSDEIRTGREWEYEQPPVLLPTPAGHVSPAAGRRVVLHDPVDGIWRYDVRAVAEAVDGVLPIVAEPDWYRGRRGWSIDSLIWFADLAEAWIEQPVESLEGQPGPEQDQSDIPADAGRSRRLIDNLTRPPVRHLRPAAEAAEMVGNRACVQTPQGPQWDMRVLGDPRRAEFPESTLNLTRGFDSLGEPVTGTVIPVTPEQDHYEWSQTGALPRVVEHATVFVWLE